MAPQSVFLTGCGTSVTGSKNGIFNSDRSRTEPNTSTADSISWIFSDLASLWFHWRHWRPANHMVLAAGYRSWVVNVFLGVVVCPEKCTMTSGTMHTSIAEVNSCRWSRWIKRLSWNEINQCVNQSTIHLHDTRADPAGRLGGGGATGHPPVRRIQPAGFRGATRRGVPT